MANRQRGEVSADFNGRTFTFVLDTEAMEAIEERLSTQDREVTWDEFWLRILKGSVRSTVVLIWGMLQRYHAADFKRFDDVRALMNEVGGPQEFIRVVKAAQDAATPDPNDLKAVGLSGKSGGKKAIPHQAAGARSSTTPAASA